MRQNTAAILTQEDFLKLKQDPQPYTRAAIAGKIVSHMESCTPDSASYRLAADIATHLQQDKHVEVRQALAEGIRHSGAAPRELIIQLANDTQDAVAVPILRDSPLLRDDDIIAIVRETEKQVRLIAVAERKFLSVTICEMLVEKNNESVCTSVLGNDTAELTESSYLRIAELHKRSSVVLQYMMKRFPMPEQAISRMRRDQEQDTEGLPKPENGKPVLASFASMSQQEMASFVSSVMLMGDYPKRDQYAALARKLKRTGKINVMVLLLSLGLGRVNLFYHLLSEITKTPLSAFEELSRPGTEQKISPLLMKVGVSPSLFVLMEWVWAGANAKLEQGIAPSGKQMAKLMSIHIREGARRGINFASTIGIPVADVLEKTA